MLALGKNFREQISSHALEDDPDECCGILAGRDSKVSKLYRMTNVDHSPYRYNMDPKELYNIYNEIDNDGLEIVGIYHSHTHSEAYPSDTDVRLVTWPDASYILVSLMNKKNPEVRAFRIVDGNITEEEIVES